MLKQPDIDESEFQAMQYTYPVLLSEDKDDGGYVVTCRDIPAVITQGDTFNEALEYAADALDVALCGRIDQAADIPAPTLSATEKQVS